METPPDYRLVLRPDCDFAAIDALLSSAGWVRQPDNAATAPLVPGEPEFAAWIMPDADASAHYSCNPAIWLRVLRFTGSGLSGPAGAIRDKLAVLDAADLAAMLASSEPRDQLRAIFAAVELSAFGLIGQIEALRIGPERVVTAAAARAVEQLGLDMLDIGVARLERERRQHPDRSALFSRLGDAAMRKSMLLQLLAAHEPPDDDTCAILRAGFADVDWRVRITAMLVAVRLKAIAVGAALRTFDLPVSGLDRRHRSALHEARKAALAELADMPLAAPVDEQTRLTAAMRNLVAGRSYDHPEPLLEWVASFARDERQGSAVDQA
jgi:hypothetical protein